MKRCLVIICAVAVFLATSLGCGASAIAQNNETALSKVDFVVSVASDKDPVILHITDTQITDASDVNENEDRCFVYLREIVSKTKPDLILLTGDLVYGKYDHEGNAFLDLIECMDSFGIPWAPVFGNHDNESNMGADWQCEQLETAKYCLFKQRTLTGNGNYTVGIEQGGELKRVFFMVDSNGCAGKSAATTANGHSRGSGGFADDQIEWYTNLANDIKALSSDTKISFAFHIQPAAFESAFDKYGISNLEDAVFIDNHESNSGSDFGVINAGLKSSWDSDNAVWNGFKTIGVDSIFIGHEHLNSGSVVYDGIRCQYGQKSSTCDRFNYVNSSGEIIGTYFSGLKGIPLVGGTVMTLSKTDSTFIDSYIFLCEKAGGEIDWDTFGNPKTAVKTQSFDFNGTDFDTTGELSGIRNEDRVATKMDDTSTAPNGFAGGVYKNVNSGEDGYATVTVRFYEALDVKCLKSLKVRMYVTSYPHTNESPLIRIFKDSTYESLQAKADYAGSGGKYDQWVEIDILPLLKKSTLIENDKLKEFILAFRYYTESTTAACYYDSIIAEYSHTINRKVVNDSYIASAATCVDKATYYKTCQCGYIDKEEATFEAGETGGHVYSDFLDESCEKCTYTRTIQWSGKGDDNQFNAEELFGTNTAIMLGDIDGDEEISVTDLAILKLNLAGATVLEDNQKLAADIDGDSEVTVTDLAKLKLYLAGAVSSLQ